MTHTSDVADIRTKAQLNSEDRSAIKQSIAMALIGVAAVTAAALLASAEKAAPRTATEPAAVVSPAASPQPTEPVGGSFLPQQATPHGDKIEASLH